MAYGYVTESGYYGRMKDGSWILFSTEGEYLQLLEEDE